MQLSLSVLALVASVVAVSAESYPHLHQRIHARDLAKPPDLVEVNKFISVFKAALNPDVVEGRISSMPYTQQIVNNATSAATYTCWRKTDFAVPYTPYNLNPAPPLVLVDIPAGETRYVSFSANFSGACTSIYDDTTIGAGGNIASPFVEMDTTEDQWSSATADVSYQTNTKAPWTSLEVDGCISDKSLCSFSCREGLDSCVEQEDVTFNHCSNAEDSPYFQSKANFGTFDGALQGGCFIKDTKQFIVTLNSST